MAQFDVGDFVLYADVWPATNTKLRVRWYAPVEVVGTSSNWIFKIRNQITGETREAHASRLKFYCDSSLQVTEELLAHVAHNSEGHVVDQLLECRYNQESKIHEVKVRWRGLQDTEDSWEPAQTLMEDILVVLTSFLRKQARNRNAQRLADALGVQLV